MPIQDTSYQANFVSIEPDHIGFTDFWREFPELPHIFKNR
jgi:hypothetical protein